MTLCTYGPPSERRKLWILRFDDRDMGEMYFEDEWEAMMCWDRYKDCWTCTLFVTAEFKNQSECALDALAEQAQELDMGY